MIDRCLVRTLGMTLQMRLSSTCSTKLPRTQKMNQHMPLVPITPPENEMRSKEAQDLDPDMVAHLERIALVDFGDTKTIEVVREAIEFVKPIQEVDTSNVTPLFSLLENESLRLREDVVESTSLEQVLRNASVVEEDFFVAPPGNIALEIDAKKYKKMD